jgi:hypothetical protein
MIPLPFADDLRDYTFTSLPLGTHVPEASASKLRPAVKSMTPTAEQLQVMGDFIRKSSMMDEEAEFNEYCKPRHTFNPVLHHINRCIEERVLYEDSDPPKVDEQLMEPFFTMAERHSLSTAKLTEAFPLKIVVKKSALARKRAVDFEATVDVPSLDEILSAERREIFEEHERSMMDAETPRALFERLLSGTEDYITEGIFYSHSSSFCLIEY